MNKALSGQAEAKATRIRDWVSITRAPIFRRRRWIVSKSDRFNPAAFGMAERTARIIQQAMVWRISRIWLAVAGEQGCTIALQPGFVELDQILHLTAGAIDTLIELLRGAVGE